METETKQNQNIRRIQAIEQKQQKRIEQPKYENTEYWYWEEGGENVLKRKERKGPVYEHLVMSKKELVYLKEENTAGVLMVMICFAQNICVVISGQPERSIFQILIFFFR